MTPTSLKEISARVVKTCALPYGPSDLPKTLIEYLSSANCCVNPDCKGNVKVKTLSLETDNHDDNNDSARINFLIVVAKHTHNVK